MTGLAANISLLFAELPFFDRFAAAARAGFAGVEILFPYEYRAADIRRALEGAGLKLALVNAPLRDDAPGGPAGLAALPGDERRFRRDMEQVLEHADATGAGLIHVMAGNARGEAAEETFIRNLQWLADARPERRFTIEPLNAADRPGYFLNDYRLAARILDRIGRANVGLQFDSYHARRIHGDALAVWEEFGLRALHVQLGQTPDRREPGPPNGKDTIDFDALLAAIEASGYAGWISAEYTPSTARTEDSLGWMSRRPASRRFETP